MFSIPGSDNSLAFGDIQDLLTRVAMEIVVDARREFDISKAHTATGACD
jgi:hypothetical protein